MRCLEAGMDDYIAKPLRYVELVQVLERNARPVEEIEQALVNGMANVRTLLSAYLKAL